MKKQFIKSAELLKPILADQFTIYLKARNYHWNITGKQFFQLHEGFEKLYDELAEDIDAVAERIRIIGGFAPGSMSEFLKLTSISEEKEGSFPAQEEMLSNITEDLQTLVNKLHQSAKKIQQELEDEVTSGILYGFIDKYEKTLWMYNATLEK